MATIKPIIDSAKRFVTLPDRVKGKEGTLDGDLYRVFRTLSTKEEREGALRRLATNQLKYPLYSKRWKEFQGPITEKLKERAENHSTHLEEEFRLWIMAAIQMAIDNLADCPTPFTFYRIRPFLQALDTILVEDILEGKEHRINKKLVEEKSLSDMMARLGEAVKSDNADKETGINRREGRFILKDITATERGERVRDVDPGLKTERAIIYSSIIYSSFLTKREKQIFIDYDILGLNIKELAQKFNTSKGNISVLLNRIVEKIKNNSY